MAIKRFLASLLTAGIALFAQAQNADLGKLLLRGNEYIGQYADNSKAKSGTGILEVNGGGVYIGDINRNAFNGRGMLIAGTKGKIKNAPNAMVYVGGWLKGKKQGRGTCYAPNGDVIYSGRFENDKPTGLYPSPDAAIDTYFSMMETPDGYYIGEVRRGKADGFGITIQENGAYWIGSSKNGHRAGIGIFLFDASTWQVVNYKGNSMIELNSSDEAAARTARIKAVNKSVWSEFWNGMTEVAEGLVKVGLDFAAAKNQGNATVSAADGGDYSSDATSSGSSGSRKKSKSSGAAKGKSDCGTAWRSDSDAYSDAETIVIKGEAPAADIKAAQQRMRRIRLKWEARGCPITKSPYED